MKSAALFSILVLCTPGCSTVQREVPVRVTSSPEGATVTMHCGSGGTPTSVTPASIQVSRSAVPCFLTLTKPGYEDEVVSLTAAHVVREEPTSSSPGSPYVKRAGANVFGNAATETQVDPPSGSVETSRPESVHVVLRPRVSEADPNGRGR